VSLSQIHLQIARRLLDDWSPSLDDALRSLRECGIRTVLTSVESTADLEQRTAELFDEVQLARGLTYRAALDADARRTLDDIVRRAHDHGYLVGAVGVDGNRHRDMLLAAGCDLAAGDRFGRAEPTNAAG
jgi:EAL domain-containing protein (putative c-di-GMP-specific phosphodiesterase class I)